MKNIRRMFLLLLIVISSNANGQLWKEYEDSAKTFIAQKNKSKVLELYIKINEELKKDSARTKTYADYASYLGSLYIDNAEYEKAELLYQEIKGIREMIFGKKDTLYGSTCFNLALVYKKLDQYEKSESLYMEAKQIRESVVGKDDLFYARICNNLGNLYSSMAEPEKAEHLLLESLEIRKKIVGENDPAYAQSLFNLSALYGDLHEYQKELPLLLQATQIRKKQFGKESSEYAQSCDNLGRLYMDMGQYNKAEPFFQEAMQVWQMTVNESHPYFTLASLHLALLYMSRAEYKKAETLFLEIQAIRYRINNKNIDYSWSCDNLAEYYNAMGQYEKAEPLFVESKQIRENILGKKDRWYAAACEKLGNLYYAMGLYQKAIPLNLEAKQVRENVEFIDSLGIVFSCTNLGNIYSATGEYNIAETMYVEARKISEKINGKISPLYAEQCFNLSELYIETGQYEKAKPLCNEARLIIEKVLGKGHPLYVESCINTGNLYWNLTKPENAKYYYREGFQLQNNQIEKVFQFTSEAEKQSYSKKIAGISNNFFSFNTFSYPDTIQGFAYDISISNRNLILLSSRQLRKAIYSTNDTSINNIYHNWISIREQLSFWLTKPIAEWPVYVKDLQEQANTLEKELTRLSSSFKNEQQKQNINWHTIKQNLKTSEAAIEFVEFQYYNGKRYTDSIYYIALVLRKDKPEPELVTLFEKRRLDSLFKGAASNDESINSIYTRGLRIRKDSSTSRSAYNIIWKPIENRLKGINKIYFSPAGLLHRIAFTALPVDSTHVLSDKYQLIQLATTASVADQKADVITASDKIYLYGGVEYTVDSTLLKQAVKEYQSITKSSRSLPEDLSGNNAFQYLPGTEKEIDEIEKAGRRRGFSMKVFDSLAASEESIKALNGTSSPEVLHIATHGFFFPDPQKEKPGNVVKEFNGGKVFKQSDNPLFRSALLFAGANSAWNGRTINDVEDGILTAYEVSNLYLPNTKLVVLSACETGLGDIQGNEGVYGLQRAFKIAGVKNLVMSLWKVPDAETAEFMQLFYKNLFARQSISDAFYKAQNIMKNKYRNYPYKWAAWILVR